MEANIMGNNKIIVSLIYAASMAGFSGVNAQQVLQSHTVVNDAKIERHRDSVTVSMQIDVSSTKVKSGASVILHPQLTSLSGTGIAYLPPVEIMGRVRSIYLERNPESTYVNDKMHVVIVKGRKSKNKNASVDESLRLDYVKTLPYSVWMDKLNLSISEDLCGCGDIDSAGTTSLCDADISFTPKLAYVVPETEVVKKRHLSGRSYLDFRLNRTNIDPSYRNNPVELQRIIASIDTVKNDKDFTIKSLQICGYASPEGSYKSNARLAEGRMKALKSYLQDRYDFSSDFIEVSSIPENWQGLKDYVQGMATLPNRREILNRMESLPSDGKELDRIEQSLRRDYPEAYSKLLKDCYPGLRRTDYRIDYVIRSFNLEEAKKLVRTAPGRLSLDEMFAVAQTYEPGSEDFNYVFDVAVRMYPDDETANINAANALLEQGRAEEALKFLDKVKSSVPEAENALGVAYLLLKDYDRAEQHMEKAIEGNLDAAKHNMEFLKL